MSFTFDGVNKLIVVNGGVEEFSTTDLYSRWKDWVIDGNAQWVQAMSPIGGQPIGGGQTISPYIELRNGWKIRPSESDHVLTVTGNIITDDETSSFVATLGNFNVSIRTIVSSNSLTSAGGGSGTPVYTPVEIAQEVWDYDITNHNTSNSFGNYIKYNLLRFSEWLTLKDK